MKHAIVLPALLTGFVALSPVGVALATPSPDLPPGPDPLPAVNVANPGSDFFCSADYSSCWIEHGDCAEGKTYSPTRMAKGCQ